MAEVQNCDFCGINAGKKCGKCLNVFYCSKDHQARAWRDHRKVCSPVKIRHNEELGRHLVATAAIKEGDVVFQEAPLVWGPSIITRPVCLGCLKLLEYQRTHLCSKCGLPFCSPECVRNPNHFAECYYAVQFGEKFPITNFDSFHPFYGCVLTARLRYQQQLDTRPWKKLNELESHCNKTRADVYDVADTQIINSISEFLMAADATSKAEVKRLWRITLINGQEVTSVSPHPTAIYHLASLLENNCKANCRKAFGVEGKVKIIAVTPIKKGEHLSICYTCPFFTTVARQQQFQDSMFFTCKCGRCTDVTEFGTNYSAINCQNKNCDGVLLPENFLVKGLKWACKQCKFEMTAEAAAEVVKRVQQDFDNIKANNSVAYETFLKKKKALLPQNHLYMMKAKIQLMFLEGNTSEAIKNLSDDDLALKISMTRQILEVMLTITPAESQQIGGILAHIGTSLIELGRRKNAAGAVQDAIEALKEAHSLLTKAAKGYRHYDVERYLGANESIKMTEQLLGIWNCAV